MTEFTESGRFRGKCQHLHVTLYKITIHLLFLTTKVAVNIWIQGGGKERDLKYANNIRMLY